MSTLSEIEAAIEKLPVPEVDELAGWLQELRARQATPPHVESWLERARGAVVPGVTTTEVITLTRALRVSHHPNGAADPQPRISPR
jgi:hypothetical protein